MRGYRVFIGCIPGDSCEVELTELLSEYARIEKVSLAFDVNKHNKQYCLGYGFVVCASKEDKRILISHANDVCYRGRFITLREYKSGRRLKEDKLDFNLRRVFIGNIPSHATNASLEKLFSRYGEVETIYSVDQTSKKHFKFGYVVFYDKESAALTIRNKNEFTFGGYTLRLEYFNGKNNYSEPEQLDATLQSADATSLLNSNLSKKQTGSYLQSERGRDEESQPHQQGGLPVSSPEATRRDRGYPNTLAYPSAPQQRNAAFNPSPNRSGFNLKGSQHYSRPDDSRRFAFEPRASPRIRMPHPAKLEPQQQRATVHLDQTQAMHEGANSRRDRQTLPLVDHPYSESLSSENHCSPCSTEAFKAGLLAQIGTNHVVQNIRLNLTSKKPLEFGSELPPAAVFRRYHMFTPILHA